MEYAPSGPHELRKARGSMGRRLSHADKEENTEEEDTEKSKRIWRRVGAPLAVPTSCGSGQVGQGGTWGFHMSYDILPS